jgi:hypothetical protein
VFYRKNWVNESKKQLEIAMQLEPDNEKYKETYRKLTEKLKTSSDSRENGEQNGSVYEGQTMNGRPNDQMGGDFCAQCIECCYCNMCLNCLCNGCCN